MSEELKEMEEVAIFIAEDLDFNNPDRSGTGWVEFDVELMVEPQLITEYPANQYILNIDGELNTMSESQDGDTMWKIWMGPSNKNSISLIVKKDGQTAPNLRIRTDTPNVHYDSQLDIHSAGMALYREKPTPTVNNKRSYAIHDFIESGEKKKDVLIVMDAVIDETDILNTDETEVNVYVDGDLFKTYKLNGGE